MSPDFISFAESQGLLIPHLIEGRIVRCKTRDHQNKENGAYFFAGDFGWVQDWARSDKPAHWFKAGENTAKRPSANIARAQQKLQATKAANQKKAVLNAQNMLSQCEMQKHNYLEKKGFPEMKWLVHENKLIIPMRKLGIELTGIESITSWGEKRFLSGQDNKLAVYRIGRGSLNILCEGYATGLTIAACVKQVCSIWVCFSAGNLVKVAKALRSGLVIADNDRHKDNTGEKAAQATGFRYFMPEKIGHDFNDYWLDVGQLKAQLALTAFLNDYSR